MLWQLVRDRQRCGKKFRRQHPLGIYTADFYCAEAQLVVEVDGSPHLAAEGKQKDAARDAWMKSEGIEVLRFGGWQVEEETQQVLQIIDNNVAPALPGMNPSSPALLPGVPGRREPVWLFFSGAATFKRLGAGEYNWPSMCVLIVAVLRGS
jgi:very-short-patch-repair endonuclease